MKYLLSSIVALGLFFSGCSSKQEVASQNLLNEKKQVSENVLDDTKDKVKDTTINVTLESIYFDFDKYTIKNDMKDIVNENQTKAAKVLSSHYAKLTIEGNCDNRGSDEYNFALGLKRAQSVKKALVEAGIDSRNIVTKSLGESSPACMENTKECWAKNRRVDFIIK